MEEEEEKEEEEEGGERQKEWELEGERLDFSSTL